MAKGEDRKQAYEIWKASGGKLPLKEIAGQLGVLPSKVRKWKSLDKWSVPSNEVDRSTPETGGAPRKKGGAPKGNQNAKGNRGGKGGPPGNRHAAGHGAPKRNQNALQTGEYATIWPDALTEEETSLCEQMNLDPLQQIDGVIRLLTLRERRMLKLLAELKRQRKQPVVSGEECDLADDVTKIVVQRENAKTSRRLIVNRQIADKILRIEEALTRVQEKKIRAIESKHRILTNPVRFDGGTGAPVIIIDNIPEEEPT